MAASLFRHADLATATYGCPTVSGAMTTSFSVNETASLSEVKNDQGSIRAVAVSEVVKEINIEGMRTGTFSATVGGLLSITMPASVDLGATTIVTGLTTNFAAEQFETFSLTARSYESAMSAS